MGCTGNESGLGSGKWFNGMSLISMLIIVNWITTPTCAQLTSTDSRSTTLSDSTNKTTESTTAPTTTIFLTRVVQKVDAICLGSSGKVKERGKPKSRDKWSSTAYQNAAASIGSADVLLLGSRGDINDDTTNCPDTLDRQLYVSGFNSFYPLSELTIPQPVLFSSWRVQLFDTAVVSNSTTVVLNITNGSPRALHVGGVDVDVPGTEGATPATNFSTLSTAKVATQARALKANYTTMDMVSDYLYSRDRTKLDYRKIYGAMLVTPDYDFTSGGTGMFWTTAYVVYQPVGTSDFTFSSFEASYFDNSQGKRSLKSVSRRSLKQLPSGYYYYSTGIYGDSTTSTGCPRGYCQLKPTWMLSSNCKVGSSIYPRCRYKCSCMTNL